MRLTLMLLLTALCCPCVFAQMIPFISVEMSVMDADAPDTTLDVTVRIYDVPSGGVVLHEESVLCVVVRGRTTVALGMQSPLRTSIFMLPQLFVGATIGSGTEYSPRTAVLPTAFAQFSDRALIAQGLAPEATGIVTSVNEVAGAVKLRAGDGLRLSRNGDELTINMDHASNEQGRVSGNGRNFQYALVAPWRIAVTDVIVCTVEPDTSGVTVVYTLDLPNNTIRFTTSAALLSHESIVWHRR